MENRIYEVLKAHNLRPSKREELMPDLLNAINNTLSGKLTFEDITSAVCEHEEIAEDVVFCRRKQKGIVRARQIIQYLCIDLDIHSSTVIGEKTNRDHATVLHARNKVSNFVDIYPKWRKKISEIKEVLLK